MAKNKENFLCAYGVYLHLVCQANWRQLRVGDTENEWEFVYPPKDQTALDRLSPDPRRWFVRN